VCPHDDIEPVALRGPIAFWVYIFHLSKYYELLDTLIIVLLRKPLIVLHAFHHCLMPFGTWFWLADDWLVGSWWCVFVNSLIHTFMYYYYMQTARGKKVPWKVYMTTAQIIQLSSGFILVCYWMYVRNSEKCLKGWSAALFSHIVNGLFIFQFIQFYIVQYLSSGKKKE
jgi:hypothetical protein